MKTRTTGGTILAAATAALLVLSTPALAAGGGGRRWWWWWWWWRWWRWWWWWRRWWRWRWCRRWRWRRNDHRVALLRPGDRPARRERHAHPEEVRRPRDRRDRPRRPSTACSRSPTRQVPGVASTTNPVDGRHRLGHPAAGRVDRRPAGTPVPPEFTGACDAQPQYAMFVSEVEMERLNLARTADAVIARKIADVTVKLQFADDDRPRVDRSHQLRRQHHRRIA